MTENDRRPGRGSADVYRGFAAPCSNHPASYARDAPPRPKPVISPRLSQPSPNIITKPEPAPAHLRRIPDATAEVRR
jgi:hypothetical protein